MNNPLKKKHRVGPFPKDVLPVRPGIYLTYDMGHDAYYWNEFDGRGWRWGMRDPVKSPEQDYLPMRKQFEWYGFTKVALREKFNVQA